ncbi:MAG: SusD/RagB family nutrient-binding outer membrane lipoprotein, partial [Bacteroidetes bacterium]|nr:SusD/RagB family nutrient-binding outer membrane lipoprotein [Bacteroidota bacterium]
MKKSIKYLLALILAVSLTACENYFGDINTDPDEPIEVTPSVLLTQVELRLAYTYWGDFSRFGSVFSGQVDGTGRQFAVIDKYNLQGNDVDAVWANCYSGILMDNRQIQRLAEDGGFKHYSGISKAIEAYTVMVMTDYWGDIPYSEALQGNGVEVSQPKFDSQEDVYNAIFALINEARADLDADNGGNAPGADDLIYAGDIDAWKAFLNVLEARGKLHLGKVSAANYDAALAALDKGGLTSDASVPFGSGSTENAPWYQYTDQRDDIDLGAAYIALYDTSSVDTIFASPDPRASVYTT